MGKDFVTGRDDIVFTRFDKIFLWTMAVILISIITLGKLFPEGFPHRHGEEVITQEN